MLKLLLLSMLTCLASMAFSDPIQPDENTPTSLPKNAITCPSPEQLKKNEKTLYWSYGKNFKSFNTSFAKKIKKFVGAQWQGVKVGKVECVYQPENAYTFTVIVYFGHLAHEPISTGWGENKGGFRNCISNNPLDCYFFPLKKENTTDPYKELESIK